MDIDMITRGEYLRFLRPGSYRMGGKAGQRFSLLSLNTAKDLSLQGAAYYFSHADLEMGSRGLSNAFSGNALEISFSEGLLLYMTELK
ncbi:MAG: hypothetical protein U5N26_06735 [Candidatus Marinimicrobia bacterium]|nr:hypothetical protein [Candidatus Neomarinimicrobiota bacterium]